MSGIRPSNATFSILIRLYSQCKLLDVAIEMLDKEPSKYNLDIEPRLFVQLVQSCIRERQGRRAIEVYEMALKHSPPTVVAHNTILATCVKLNMLDTAAEVLAAAAAAQRRGIGVRVDARDAGAVLEA